MTVHAPIRRLIAAIAVAATSLASPGCGAPAAESTARETPPPKGLGESVGDAGADTRVLREANAAAGDIIRASADCDAARPLGEPTKKKLDELTPQLQTPTGRTSMDSLKRQVQNIIDACG